MPVMASTGVEAGFHGAIPARGAGFVSPSFSRVTVAVEVILLPENIWKENSCIPASRCRRCSRSRAMTSLSVISRLRSASSLKRRNAA